MISLYLAAASVITIYFSMLFAWAIQSKNYAVADIGWGFGFIVTAIYCNLTTPEHSPLELLTTALIVLWGCRLSIYIYLRNKGRPEDFRYRQFREKWTQFTNLQAFVKLFLPQAAIMLVVSTAILVAANSSIDELPWYSWIFSCTAIIGFLYESISDYQLAVFKRSLANSGKIMTQGLWAYSRHPNYFGEIVFWWSISLLVTTSTGHYEALVSGLAMNLIIRFVSGVPMLEQKYRDNPAYTAYMQSTNSLIPRIRL